MPKKTIKAFTLLELLVVIAILGVFTVVAYPNISKWIADREVRKEVYETVEFIKERKSEVTSGKYGMTQLKLKPNFDFITALFLKDFPSSLGNLNFLKSFIV